MADNQNQNDHFLTQPKTIKLLWWGFVLILALTVLADFAVKHKAYFGVDGTFGFAAWFGFIACVLIVVISKAFGVIFKRPDTYYDD